MSVSTEYRVTGGCHCRDVCYEASSPVYRLTHCHCSICRAFGGTLMSWITLSKSRFTIVRGSPKLYSSSPTGRREFCGRCGSHLTFRHYEDHETIDVAIGTLDDPESFPPNNQIWTSERLPYIGELNGLPSSPNAYNQTPHVGERGDHG